MAGAAAARLERKLRSRKPAEARKWQRLLAEHGPPGDDADNAMWRLGWHSYRAGDHQQAARWFGNLVAATQQQQRGEETPQQAATALRPGA